MSDQYVNDLLHGNTRAGKIAYTVFNVLAVAGWCALIAHLITN